MQSIFKIRSQNKGTNFYSLIINNKIKEKGRCRQKELHLLISFGGKICYNKSIAWQRKCDGDKRKCHAKDEMPEDSDPFQDGTVLKEAFDRLNKYVVG